MEVAEVKKTEVVRQPVQDPASLPAPPAQTVGSGTQPMQQPALGGASQAGYQAASISHFLQFMPAAMIAASTMGPQQPQQLQQPQQPMLGGFPGQWINPQPFPYRLPVASMANGFTATAAANQHMSPYQLPSQQLFQPTAPAWDGFMGSPARASPLPAWQGQYAQLAAMQGAPPQVVPPQSRGACSLVRPSGVPSLRSSSKWT